MSCLRAGLRPLAIDLYADTDTDACCETRRVDAAGYPGSILAELERLPPLPVLWTGGLEAHPALLATIADRQPLIGPPLGAVREATDPQRFVRTIIGAGLRAPRTLAPGRPLAPLPGGRWLSKPLGGAGGSGIREITVAKDGPDRFHQELVEGSPASAVFLASKTPRPGDLQVDLLACTRQLIGVDWLRAPRFAYCGTIAPLLTRRRETLNAIRHAGHVVASELGLLGLFGIDLVIREDGVPVFLEINPRYTASVECIERAHGISAIDLHLRACRGDPVAVPSKDPGGVGAKAIVFAADDETFTSPSAETLRELGQLGGRLADLPREGEPIRARAPIFTILCDAEEPDDALARLRRLLAAVRPGDDPGQR